MSSIHIAYYVDILNMGCYISGDLSSEVAVRGEGGVAGERKLVGEFIHGIGAPWHSFLGEVHCDSNEHLLRFDVHRFLWPVYYIILSYYVNPLTRILECNNHSYLTWNEPLCIRTFLALSVWDDRAPCFFSFIV